MVLVHNLGIGLEIYRFFYEGNLKHTNKLSSIKR